MTGSFLQGINHQIQRFGSLKTTNTTLPKFLFILPCHCGNKRLRQDQCIFNLISHVEYQSATARFTMQHSKAMG